jgi:hypothetical protein
MKAEITIMNLTNNNEEVFTLPLDMEEVELFLDNNQSDYKITDIEDTHNLLKNVEAYNSNYNDINELVELIENSCNDIKETCVKIQYHFENNSGITIKSIISNFTEIEDKYTVYEKYLTTENWASLYNDEYKFVDITDTQKIYHNFNEDGKDSYLRDLTATVDLGEKLQEEIYDMSISDMLDTVEDMGMLKVLDISRYLDWKSIVKNLRASAIYIEKFKGHIIVHNG